MLVFRAFTQEGGKPTLHVLPNDDGRPGSDAMETVERGDAGGVMWLADSHYNSDRFKLSICVDAADELRP